MATIAINNEIITAIIIFAVEPHRQQKLLNEGRGRDVPKAQTKALAACTCPHAGSKAWEIPTRHALVQVLCAVCLHSSVFKGEAR